MGLTTKEEEIETIAKRLIDNEIYLNQTCLIGDLLANGEFHGFSWEDVTNYELSDEQLLDEHPIETTEFITRMEYIEELRDNCLGFKEIFQWFSVSAWLADKLSSIGECVLTNDYGSWWGRDRYTQEIILDGTFQKIASKLGE